MVQLPQPRHGPGSLPFASRPGDIWQMAWRWRLFLALGLLAGLGLGAVAFTRIPPVYQSEAQILVWQKRPDAMTSVDSRQGSVEDSLATHQELLKSSAIIDRALRDPALADLRSFQGEQEAPIEVVRKLLAVTRGKSLSGGNNVLQVSFRGKVARECAAILAAVLDSYKTFLDQKYQTFAGDTFELVLRKRADLEKELAKKEASYRAFLEKSPLLMKKPDGSDLRRERLTSMQTRRSALLLRRAELQSQLDSIEEARRQGRGRATILALIAEFSHKGEDIEPARTPAMTTSDQLTPLLLEEQKLLERYGAGHPEVKSVRQRIAIARAVLVLPAAAWDATPDAAGGRGPVPNDPVQLHVLILRQKLHYVVAAEERLSQLFETEHHEARQQARYEIQDESFRTGILLTRQSYESLNKRLQDVSLVKGVGGYDIEVITPPSEGRKVAPSATLIFPAALLLGGLTALGLVYLRERIGDRLRCPEDVREQFALPIVGCIPPFTAEAKGRTRVARLAAPTGLDPLLCTYHHPRSGEAEAYRSLRNALFFQARDPARKVIQVTSPSGGDGKSILAANLCVCMAQAGKKVLLIDADLRGPRIHQLFGLGTGGGLGSVLAGERALKESIQDSGIPGLSVLSSGPPSSHPGDLLTAPRFKEMLDQLREEYDFILVDSPALLSVTDAAAVAARVDGVLLVVRLTRNTRPALGHALEVLAMVGAKVLGVVVNGTTPTVHRLRRGKINATADDVHAEGRNGWTTTGATERS